MESNKLESMQIKIDTLEYRLASIEQDVNKLIENDRHNFDGIDSGIIPDYPSDVPEHMKVDVIDRHNSYIIDMEEYKIGDHVSILNNDKQKIEGLLVMINKPNNTEVSFILKRPDGYVEIKRNLVGMLGGSINKKHEFDSIKLF